jgi:hypothetical protein
MAATSHTSRTISPKVGVRGRHRGHVDEHAARAFVRVVLQRALANSLRTVAPHGGGGTACPSGLHVSMQLANRTRVPDVDVGHQSSQKTAADADCWHRAPS